MRQAGSIANSQDAQRLAAYLISQGIDAVAEQEASQWSIWVREEDQVPKAKEELARYMADPQHPRYEGAEKAAAERLREEAKRRAKAQKNVVNPANKWGNERVTAGPLTHAIILLCVIVFLLTDFGKSRDGVVTNSLRFVNTPSKIDPRGLTNEEIEKRIAYAHDRSPMASIKRGELWRLVTPIFIHHDFLHILFYMWMFHLLASLIESRRGTVVLGLLVLAIAVASNLGQALTPSEWGGSPQGTFGGMSGVVYGLLGYAWMKTRYEPLLGIRIRDDVVFFMLACLLVLWLGSFLSPDAFPIANWAHAIGFISGVVIGYLPVLFRQMRT